MSNIRVANPAGTRMILEGLKKYYNLNSRGWIPAKRVVAKLRKMPLIVAKSEIKGTFFRIASDDGPNYPENISNLIDALNYGSFL